MASAKLSVLSSSLASFELKFLKIVLFLQRPYHVRSLLSMILATEFLERVLFYECV